MTIEAKKEKYKTPKLEGTEGIEIIRHSKENMQKFTLKIEAMPT